MENIKFKTSLCQADVVATREAQSQCHLLFAYTVNLCFVEISV